MSGDAWERVLDDAERIAIDAATDAGALIRAAWSRGKKVDVKAGPADLVTETDKACEQLIFQRIRGYFPGHRFVGEEGTTESAGGTADVGAYRHAGVSLPSAASASLRTLGEMPWLSPPKTQTVGVPPSTS